MTIDPSELNLGKRFVRTNSGDYTQVQIRDRSTGKFYTFDTVEEANQKMFELRASYIHIKK